MLPLRTFAALVEGTLRWNRRQQIKACSSFLPGLRRQKLEFRAMTTARIWEAKIPDKKHTRKWAQHSTAVSPQRVGWHLTQCVYKARLWEPSNNKLLKGVGWLRIHLAIQRAHTGPNPGLGTKIPHAKEQVSSEPQLLGPGGRLGGGFSYVS